MKVMVRRDTRGLSIYVPKKDLEEPVVAQQHDALWGDGSNSRMAGCLNCRKWKRNPGCRLRSTPVS